MSTAVVALVLLPIAVGLVGLLLALIAQPLIGPAVRAVERARLRRCSMRAARADRLLATQQRDAALRELEAAFCLMIVRADHNLVGEIARHHVGVLSRLLTIADHAPQPRVRLLALAKVDRLLERRQEMQRAHLQLRSRSLRDGRRIQLERELRRNAREVRTAVRELVADIHLLANRRAAIQ
jgi:hypothetical protein